MPIYLAATMLYLLFILLLVAVIFAVVWVVVRAKKSVTGEPDTLAEPDDA